MQSAERRAERQAQGTRQKDKGESKSQDERLKIKEKIQYFDHTAYVFYYPRISLINTTITIL